MGQTNHEQILRQQRKSGYMGIRAKLKASLDTLSGQAFVHTPADIEETKALNAALTNLIAKVNNMIVEGGKTN
jgi:hypothetical protein